MIHFTKTQRPRLRHWSDEIPAALKCWNPGPRLINSTVTVVSLYYIRTARLMIHNQSKVRNEGNICISVRHATRTGRTANSARIAANMAGLQWQDIAQCAKGYAAHCFTVAYHYLTHIKRLLQRFLQVPQSRDRNKRN
jgi:hypothetical protein